MPKQPQLKIFTTGGTIDKVYFDARSEFEIGEPLIGAILTEAQVAFDFEVVQLMRKDSLELNDEDRRTIREAVQAAPESRIVITHGTDTMAATAEALLGIDDKTIVLVGALNPARFRSSDAIFNIGLATGAVQAMQPGVYIAMNGRIFSAGHVKKNRDANRFEETD
ncbi:MAG: asparaginase [Gammaproteobacteria bacterium]|nr:asparaginase [Gammaproteobacteria bacterium]